MKRVRGTNRLEGGVVPDSFAPRNSTRHLFQPLPMADGSPSPCWLCADAPCAKFAQEEVGRPLPIEAPLNPDSSVCPTDALSIGVGGLPVVDQQVCIGCGLCVIRCPVGAIHLDKRSAVAVVSGPATGKSTSPVEFELERALAENSLDPESAPFLDADLASVQVERTMHIQLGPRPAAALRRLVRNAFLLDGAPTRMSNPGDNSAWAEVATAAMDRIHARATVGAVQIEAGSLSLDAHRRLLAGTAVAISRWGVSKADLVPIIVVVAQPNLRTDYYRILSDVRKYLDMRIRTVPLAVLYLGIRDRGNKLLGTIQSGAYVDSDDPSNEQWAQGAFGASSGSVPGLSPIK